MSSTPKMLNVVQSTNPSTMSPCVAPFLFLAATHVHLLQSDEEYYGSDDDSLSDIPLGNTIGALAERYFGVNFEDDDDDYADGSTPWFKAICKATSDEISQMLIHAVLRELIDANIVDKDSSLYAVLTEVHDMQGYMRFFDEQAGLAADDHSPHDVVGQRVQLWTGFECQNSTLELPLEFTQSIQKLPVFGSVAGSGFSVIRVR